jgi:hypothetical protein
MPSAYPSGEPKIKLVYIILGRKVSIMTNGPAYFWLVGGEEKKVLSD